MGQSEWIKTAKEGNWKGKKRGKKEKNLLQRNKVGKYQNENKTAFIDIKKANSLIVNTFACLGWLVKVSKVEENMFLVLEYQIIFFFFFGAKTTLQLASVVRSLWNMIELQVLWCIMHNSDRWQATVKRWQVKCDKCQVTSDKWQVTLINVTK